MRVIWLRAAIAGILGTMASDVVGLALTRRLWAVPTVIGQRLGTGLPGGLVVHYGNGIILAIIFAAIAPSLWGSHWTRVGTYIVIELIFGVYFFFLPMAGLGIAGWNFNHLTPFVAFLQHAAYGLVIGALYTGALYSTATAQPLAATARG